MYVSGMGRPLLGSAARTVTATIRITPAEAQALTDLAGSPTKGLRALLDASKASVRTERAEPGHRVDFENLKPPSPGLFGTSRATRGGYAAGAKPGGLKPPPDSVTTRADKIALIPGVIRASELPPIVPAPDFGHALTMPAVEGRHRHRADTSVTPDERFVAGQREVQPICECGEPMSWRKA